ncbi:GntR family transcriptional regulator [Nocardia sp. CDC153]|uniref:GntR family transcriptional regulator n=1 Tax=Nocardia sp. CDC153 TaxID=3112167 RepID=UPI002DB5B220|nr:GntR family transcriptional regulator [Nocardia sp. CDC153]MEC3957524.1 GntR family transcriptional regulator [Nocardia sp. CDC153]
MTEPRYVQIANKYARDIRSGKIPAGTWLPSYSEIASSNSVSEIVVRRAVDQLRRWGLVQTVERRGTRVVERPTLTRLAPERQVESPETTFGNETDGVVSVDREINRIAASGKLASQFGISAGEELVHVVTRAAEDGEPISVSDTYHLPDQENPDAAYLEETLAERVPSRSHLAWLKIPDEEPVMTVRQRFLDANDRVLMISDVSYPKHRYQAFSFRMTLPSADASGESEG